MTVNLAALDDHALSEEVRRREVAFQNALAEVARRAAEKGIPDWSERNTAAQLSLKRANAPFAARLALESPEDLPPPLFRMGYEWAALSIVYVLESILGHPTSEIHLSQDFEPVGKGLYKPVGKPRPSDPRRRAAFDLISELESFLHDRQRGFFCAFKRKSHYRPEDDAALAEAAQRKTAGLSGALFR